MSYQSLGFLLFSAIVMLVYYAVPGKYQKHVLLAASIVFYAMAGIKYIPFLAATTAVAFICGKKIGAIYEEEAQLLKACAVPAEKKAVRASQKKKALGILRIALLVTAGLLVVCKYTGFILENICALFSIPQLTGFRMIVPLGISFYTFMAVGYMLDIYWKRYSAEKEFIPFAAFLTYFPHVVQGPIDRYNEFRKQLPGDEKLRFDAARITRGLQLTMWGFFKKLVIADRLNIFVNTVYGDYTAYRGLIFVIATALYSIQIYADFSGCIDIVSGISEAMGIKLRKNFDHPYFSRTMPEFWRRWHISLGEWFKDYIYYPVSVSNLSRKLKKNKKSKKAGELAAACLPVTAVWLLTGIWHGASWNFVIWGLFHCLLIVLSILCADMNRNLTDRLHINTDSRPWRLWQMTRTFILCGVGRVFFRAPDMPAVAGIFRNTFSGLGLEFVAGKALFKYGVNRYHFYAAMVAILILWIVDLMQEKFSLRDAIAKRNIVIRWSIVFIGLFAIIIFGAYGPGYDASSFIYEQF
ncbi:MAG: MBOAT family protein [Clostridiales bacterium]|nr:MBOAT family protein [Clostridiales bacterium]